VTGRPPIRFGVLGYADIARRRTVPALLAEPDAELVAVASRDDGRAREFAGRFGAEPVHGYADLLRRPDIDAVYVPLPAMLHAEWIGAALEAGKHVLAEKPMTADGMTSRRLARLARDRSLVLAENFSFLHHSQQREVARLLGGGAIGRLRGFASAFTIPPKPPSDIRNDPRTGGGAFLDVGVYPVRAAVEFLPDLEVAGAVFRRRGEGGPVVSGEVLLHTPTGVCAQLTFGMEHSYRSSWEFSGSDGRLRMDRVFTAPAHHRPVVCVERQDRREETTLPADDQLGNTLRWFVAAVRGDVDPGPALETALRHAALVDRITETARVVVA
jgi:NDP-hexose-3-ketoreductase